MPVWSAPVRYAECDQQGVVFNANYMAYADEAADYLWRKVGFSYADLVERGFDTSVVASELQWSSSARWGDVIDVDGEVEKVGQTSFVIALMISVEDRGLLSGAHDVRDDRSRTQAEAVAG